MLKALLLDMDETLCDTSGANTQAKILLAQAAQRQFGCGFDGEGFATAYVAGIYRDWSEQQRIRYLPICETQSEESFRAQLICDLVVEQGISNIDNSVASSLQQTLISSVLKLLNFTQA